MLGVSVLVQAQDVLDQLLLAEAGVQCGYGIQLGERLAGGQHDALGSALQKEGGMLEVDVRGDEVVGIHVGRVGHQFVERAERTDDGHGYPLL